MWMMNYLKPYQSYINIGNVIMQRRNFKNQTDKPDAILTSDWHLREDTPTCFTGDFQKEQWDAMRCIKEMQDRYSCPVICAGDVFDKWKPSPWLLSMTIDYLPDMFYCVYGQHDLPQHSMELSNKSGLYTLLRAGKINLLWQCHYGQFPTDGQPKQIPGTGTNILVWHYLTYTKAPFPGAKDGMAERILRKYPEYDLIVTGDNHQSFYTTYEGRLLVNPGNLTRQSADQIDYKPRVALWYAKTNTIEWVYLPIQEGVISREHIDVKAQRDERIHAFVSQLNDDWQVELSFEDNLERAFESNNTEEPVKQIIYKALDV